MAIAMISYHAQDSGWSEVNSLPVQNWGGEVGAFLASYLVAMVGYIGFLCPFLLGYLLFLIIRRRWLGESIRWGLSTLRLLGLLLSLCTASALLAQIYQAKMVLTEGGGGILGRVLLKPLLPLFGEPGTALLLVALLLVGGTLLFGISWLHLCRISLGIAGGTGFAMGKMSCGGFARWRQWRALAAEKRAEKRQKKALMRAEKEARTALLAAKQAEAAVKEDERALLTLDLPEPSLGKAFKPEGASAALPRSNKQDLNFLTAVGKSQGYPDTEALQAAVKTKRMRAVTGKLPSIDLLDEAEKSQNRISKEALEYMARLVEEKLSDFAVQAQVVGVCPGPIVTRFELQLAPGTKVSKLTTISKDLARSLSAISVRIVEVIPGKSVVGLELPNEHREIVRLKEVLKSRKFKESPSPLLMGLGKDIAGEPAFADLSKMPHLLVAGTTGSGKSVGLNAMLLSMLLRSKPEALRLIMIDPKMLELSIYEGIPHLLTPVVTDMKQAANALRWCVKEMDQRYRLMAACGVRNIAGLNAKITEAEAAGQPLLDPLWQPNPAIAFTEQSAPKLEPLPYVVVLVDEFADMIMVVGKKVEELIARLAQKARASGIHLILATQRPSVDVITGLIKANIPTRMAFQVSSKIDSRTILDQQGAEQLLGHGDMLYLPPGTGVPMRIHGAFVADHEVHHVVSAWRALGEPDYIEEILTTENIDEAEAEEGDAVEKDELYDQAVQIVIQSQRASISAIQRRFKIGYNRAARLVEQMERAGIVSEIQNNGMREVLVSGQGGDR